MDEKKNISEGNVSKQCLSIGAVADYLGLTVSTVYRLVKRGAIPGFKVGGQWRFTQENLEAWIVDRMTIERLKAENRQRHSPDERST